MTGVHVLWKKTILKQKSKAVINMLEFYLLLNMVEGYWYAFNKKSMLVFCVVKVMNQVFMKYMLIQILYWGLRGMPICKFWFTELSYCATYICRSQVLWDKENRIQIVKSVIAFYISSFLTRIFSGTFIVNSDVIWIFGLWNIKAESVTLQSS